MPSLKLTLPQKLENPKHPPATVKQSTPGVTQGEEVPDFESEALAFGTHRGGQPWQGPAAERLVMPRVCNCEIPLSPWLVPAASPNKWAQMGDKMTGLRPQAQLAVPRRGIALTRGHSTRTDVAGETECPCLSRHLTNTSLWTCGGLRWAWFHSSWRN